MTDSPRAVFILTTAIAPSRMLCGQCRFFRQAGFDVSVIASPGRELDEFGRAEGVRTVGIAMERRPSPLSDLVALVRIYLELKRLRPDVVEVGTPKAGLLGGLAAWVARVPVRVYTLHGLRAETLRGLGRWLLLGLERLSCALASQVVCVSKSLRELATDTRILKKARVLACGSANGVDAVRFRPEPGAGEGLTIGFAGRFTRDKGIAELLEAYLGLRNQFPGLRLLLLGDTNGIDQLEPTVRGLIGSEAGIIWPKWVENTPNWYPMMSLLALPTRREGLPQCVLEAAACSVPTVAFRATGTVDAIVDGLTGRLVEPHEFAAAMGELLRDRAQREQLGRNARRRVEQHFRPEQIWKAKLELWRELAAATRMRRPGVASGRCGVGSVPLRLQQP